MEMLSDVSSTLTAFTKLDSDEKCLGLFICNQGCAIMKPETVGGVSMIREAVLQYPKVEVESDWYEVFQLPHDIYAIMEPYHFQEVISFLIVGETASILLDTGMGLEPIRPIAEILINMAKGPNVENDIQIIPISTHSHFDHIGGNYEFPYVWGWPAEDTVRAAETDLHFTEDDPNIQPEAFERPVANLNEYCRRAYTLKPLKEHQELDLGDSLWKVKFVGGHSDDSIVLYNEEQKLLCTGDLIYPGPLYVKTGLKEYTEACERLAEEFSDYTLICSHNIPLAEGSLLSRVANAFGQIRRKELTGAVDSRGRTMYRQGDVEILLWPNIGE